VLIAVDYSQFTPMLSKVKQVAGETEIRV